MSYLDDIRLSPLKAFSHPLGGYRLSCSALICGRHILINVPSRVVSLTRSISRTGSAWIPSLNPRLS